MKKILPLIFFLFTFQAHADWTKQDTITESVFLSTLAVDAMQTIDIKNHPGMYETNPILGRHPSDDQVIAYFITTGYLHYQIAKHLDSKYRKIWQYMWISVEVGVINHNQAMGVGMRIPL